MTIHSHFIGGNIRVKELGENTAVLENEYRDSLDGWFYWAFCVENAEDRQITFHMQKNRLGYWGPAVSHDLQTWHWLGSCDGDSFTYSFAKGEKKVYFAHHMLYHPDRFLSFAKECGLTVAELCRSRKGRSVPCLSFGEGKRSILLTARHHACESTGSYVLEGVLTELLAAPIPNTRILCVPFVDYDGVIDGDQGKARAPHDHNRDYIEKPIYPEVCAIQAYTAQHGCHYGFDFHAPWHKGGENDTVFVVRNRADRQEAFDRFASLLESEITEQSLPYRKTNDFPANTGWNMPSPNFAFTMHNRPECLLAFSLETAYFGTEEHRVSEDGMLALGKCFARALRRFDR